MFFLLSVFLYVLGGVIIAKENYKLNTDRLVAIGAAVAWPVTPAKWVYNKVKALIS